MAARGVAESDDVHLANVRTKYEELKSRNSGFTSLTADGYKAVFLAAYRGPGLGCMGPPLAKEVLKILVEPHKPKTVENLVAFLEDGPSAEKYISKDCWEGMLPFFQRVDEDFGNLGKAIEEAGPTLIDDFGDWLEKKHDLKPRAPVIDRQSSPARSTATTYQTTTTTAGYSTTTTARTYNYSSSYYSNDDGMTGLLNQGATCYLNSLIQTLYMTPEFRAALYAWQYREGVDKAPDRCIPLQLQLLFAKMQEKTARAVETTPLTTSFGWDGAEAFTQHDVQELWRLLFEALEKSFKGTPQDKMVDALFQGTIKDYVKCKECRHESMRRDTFLDVSLEVKDAESVEQALANFVLPEILNGDNQYECEGCGKKVDALKGLSFLEFPYFLTIQLKRFTFDFSTMRRKKLNKYCEFPLNLNLDEFHAQISDAINEENIRVFKKEVRKEATTNEYWRAYDKQYLQSLINRYRNDPYYKGQSYYQAEASKMETFFKEKEEQEKLDREEAASRPGSKRARPRTDSSGVVLGAEREGEYSYELYSILIHSGGSMGGHYYAYIKNLDSGKWLQFNDSSVRACSMEDIRKSYGDKDAQDDSTYGSYGANAYMLVYRRKDPNRNRHFESVVPTHVHDGERMAAEAVEASKTKGVIGGAADARGEPNKYTVRYYEDYLDVEVEVKAYPTTEVGAFATAALARLQEAAAGKRADPKFANSRLFAPGLAEGKLRLRQLTGREEEPSKPLESLPRPRAYYTNDPMVLLLDIAEPIPDVSRMFTPSDASASLPELSMSDSFSDKPLFTPDTTRPLHVVVWDAVKKAPSPALHVMVPKEWTLGHLRRMLVEKLGLEDEHMRTFTFSYSYGEESTRTEKRIFDSYGGIINTHSVPMLYVDDKRLKPDVTDSYSYRRLQDESVLCQHLVKQSNSTSGGYSSRREQGMHIDA